MWATEEGIKFIFKKVHWRTKVNQINDMFLCEKMKSNTEKVTCSLLTWLFEPTRLSLWNLYIFIYPISKDNSIEKVSVTYTFILCIMYIHKYMHKFMNVCMYRNKYTMERWRKESYSFILCSGRLRDDNWNRTTQFSTIIILLGASHK